MLLKHRFVTLASPLGIAAVALLCGCAPQQYAYVPVASVSTTSADTPTTAIAETTPTPAPASVLPSSSDGGVRLDSLGVAKIPATAAADGSSVSAMHLRMTVTNRSADTWTVDGAEQRLEMGDDAKGRVAIYALSGGGGRATTIEVPSGNSRAMDLYYPLPDGMRAGRDLPRFDAVWTVQGAGALVSERTVFERIGVSRPIDGQQNSRSYFNDPFNAAGTYQDTPPDSVGYPQAGEPIRWNPRLPNPRPNED